jgi:GT2 family glycosyltransferase
LSSHSPSPSVSVVIASHNEGENLVRTVHSLLAGLPSEGEIIVVDDASTDGSADCLTSGYGGVTVLRCPGRQGAIRARNLGVERARGEVVVFSDAHIQAPLDWTGPLVEALACPSVGATGPAISVMDNPAAKGFGFRWSDPALTVDWLGQQYDEPYAVPMLGAGFMAMRREVFQAVGGFDPGLILWGFEDAELCLRLWLLGYECRVVPDVDVAHLFRASHPYAVDWEMVLHNMLRVAVVHFGEERTRRMVACLTSNNAFPAAFARLCAGDTWARREALHAARAHDDDWFFHRFGMEW